MYIDYSKLWKLLIDKNMTKTELMDETGLSSRIIAKLSKNETVTTETLVKLVKDGNGVGYIQEEYVRGDLENGSLKKLNISFTPPKLDIYCGYISDTLAYAPKKFIDYVLSVKH